MRSIPQHQSEKPMAKHRVYGVPTQDKTNLLSVFQNDKFPSPIDGNVN